MTGRKEFVPDSLLEERRFELSVPRGTDDALEIALFRPLRHFPFRPGRPARFARGTSSSNPFRSTGESVANLIQIGLRCSPRPDAHAKEQSARRVPLPRHSA
jgi:hypothetical protein